MIAARSRASTTVAQLADMERCCGETTVSRLMLESGVTFIDPKRAYISSTQRIGRDTVIYPNVTIEGETRDRRRLHHPARELA